MLKLDGCADASAAAAAVRMNAGDGRTMYHVLHPPIHKLWTTRICWRSSGEDGKLKMRQSCIPAFVPTPSREDGPDRRHISLLLFQSRIA